MSKAELLLCPAEDQGRKCAHTTYLVADES